MYTHTEMGWVQTEKVYVPSLTDVK